MKEFRNPQNVHQPLGLYSHQVEVSGNERLLVLSGQVGMRVDGTIPEDQIEQLEVIFENILLNLEAANMSAKDILKLNYYVVGEMDHVKRRAIITSKIGEHRPCSTFIYVAGLVSPVYKVEVEALVSRTD
jgi:2-iminobutanoate/2-iminopropanoate deaminase